MTDDEAKAIYVLLREGYKWEDIENMTPFQINFILTGLSLESKQLSNKMSGAKRRMR